MARDNKVSMPQSIGGLVRYFDEYKSKLHFKPHYVMAAIVIVIILELILNSRASTLLP